MNQPLDLVGLRAAERSLVAPFDLALASVERGPFVLHCEQVLRLLPARRLVAKVAWQNSPAVLKLFFDDAAERYFARELAGLAKLSQAGIATPDILARLNLLGGACGLLLSYLPAAETVHWQDTAGIEAAARLLADLHGQGVWQDDLHLDNFLKSGNEVFAIDGDGVRSARAPLGEKPGFDNLGMLLAQRPPAADDAIERIGRVYCERRGWSLSDERLSRLAVAVATRRRQRVRRYLVKVQRDCTEFAVTRTFRQYRVCVRERMTPELLSILEAPELSMSAGARMKTGNSATVVRVTISPRESVVLKRYNVKNVLHGLRRAFKPRARFRRAWINGQRLRFLGIPTAHPLALLEKRAGPWRGVAYLVAEDLGNLDLLTEVGRDGLSDRRCAQVTEIFVNLQRAGLTHSDTKASNFIVSDDRVFLIDLDAMVEGTKRRKKDLARFLQNWEAKERGRFEEAFRQAGLV